MTLCPACGWTMRHMLCGWECQNPFCQRYEWKEPKSAPIVKPGIVGDFEAIRKRMADIAREGRLAGPILPEWNVAVTVSVSNLGRLLSNHCDKHKVVWGDGEHEGCGLCSDEDELDAQDSS